MSGVAKGIGKVFKAVGSVVKKILAPALAVAAIVFTGGAALGLAPLAGGFGGAVASTLGAIGVPTTGVIGSALTGAVTQAGMGAAIGGVTSMATGGDFTDGAGKGALLGAATGGLTGALGAGAAAPAASSGVTMSSRGMAPAMSAGGVNPSTFARPTSALMAADGAATAGAATAGAATNGPGGIIGGLTRGMMGDGGSLIGSTLGGLGKGLLAGMAQKEEMAYLEDNQDRITESYDVPTSVLNGGTHDSKGRPSFGPRRYVYDRKARRIVQA
jgi:hypothetical protein